MAEELDRSGSYNLVYGLACSLHHANFEGLMGYHEMKDGKLEMTGPPSFVWTGAALVAAHDMSARPQEVQSTHRCNRARGECRCEAWVTPLASLTEG